MVNRRDQSEPPEFNPDSAEVYSAPRVNPYNVGTGHSHAAPPKRLMSKKKRKIWPWVLIALMVLLFGSCAAILSSASKNDSTPVRVAPVPSQAIESPASASAQGSATISIVPPSNGTSFNDGEWLVGKGKEVLPGTYRTPGAKDRNGSYFCALVIKKDGNPVDAVSSSGADEPARVVLKEGQTASSQGCQTWTKVG